MTDTWTAESGILRKHKAHEPEELLVFGYSCKLFRDDEKALSIDQGKHLIPWMGDEKVKIDRYDGRGALGDLQAHEAISQWDHTEGLSDEERRAEQLCDEERYRSLYEHVVEEEMYREEQIKRLHQQHSIYGQVPFHYSEDTTKNEESEVLTKSEDVEDDEPFIPSPTLDIPVNMKLPINKKLSAIIERTAGFIAQQGGQMEILLKAKQQHNPQFEFLNHDNELFAFYRHILMAIKTGRYKPKGETTSDTEKAVNNEIEEASYYLHPSLGSNITRVDSAPPLPSTIPAVNYKPSADCAYSMLVHKIKGTNMAVEEKPVSKESTQNSIPDKTTFNSEQYAQWNQYYNSEQYQEYYRQYYLAHYGFDPMTMEHNVNGAIEKAAIIYNTEKNPIQETSSNILNESSPDALKNEKENGILGNANDNHQEHTKCSKSKIRIGALAHYYNSDSSDSDIEEENFVAIPSDSEKLIIMKMASYVAKNGKEFEEIVKGKNDPRFDFLHPNHKYHIFYKTKLNFQLSSLSKVINFTSTKESKEQKDRGFDEIIEDQKTKLIGPVSFSIKKPKEAEHITIKPALALEDSDEEQETAKEYSNYLDKGIVEETINKIEETVVEQCNEVDNHIKSAEVVCDDKDNSLLNNNEAVMSDVKGIVQSVPEDNMKIELRKVCPDNSHNEMISDPELPGPSSPCHADNFGCVKGRFKSTSSEDVLKIHNVVNEVIDTHNICKLQNNICIDLTDDIDDKQRSVEDEINIEEVHSKINVPEGRVKQIQLHRKKKAMAFLSQLKSENVIDVTSPQQSILNDESECSFTERLEIRHKSSRKRRIAQEDTELHSSKSKKYKKKHSHSHSSKSHKHRKHNRSNRPVDD